MKNILLTRCKKYAKDVVVGKEKTTWEVKKQCEIFLNDYNIRQKDKKFPYRFDTKICMKINKLLTLFNFATGYVAGEQVLEYLAPFQCFFIANIFGWRFKNNRNKFRYNDNTLFIPRKNAKTATIAIVFILLMLTEQEYSEFYSICLNKELAAEIRKIMVQILEASPQIKKRFIISKTKTGDITCDITKSFFQPRVAESGKNNSIRPSAFVADEHANFKDNSNFNAMRSGQKNVINPLAFRTTTAYEIDGSIMINDLKYIRKVLKREVKNERVFALLYYADKENMWTDEGLYQANPLRLEENYQIMREERAKCLVQEDLQGEFITKTLNIFVAEKEYKKYLNINNWKELSSKHVELKSKEVIVGVDASLTTDLTAVIIMYKENGKYYIVTHAFVPRESLSNRREEFDYIAAERRGECTIIDGLIIDYNIIQEYIENIPIMFGCKIKAIATDPYNMTQTSQNLSKKYDVIFIKQSYSELSAPIKDFRNEVYLKNIIYEESKLLDWTIENTETITGRASGDVLLNKKNKNKTRIDLVVAIIFAYSRLYINYVSENHSKEEIEDWIAMQRG